MKPTIVCWLLIAAFSLTAVPAGAQELDPNNKRGFEPAKVYNFSGVDSVNTFSGNLTLRIPIGQSYSVRPGFSYQFFLSYNSRVWDYSNTTVGTNEVRHSIPEPYSNAGLGWLLTVGEMRLPGASSGWRYISADGAEHEFFYGLRGEAGEQGVLYTNDSSYMRMKITPVTATSPAQITRIDVETGDGLTHTFTNSGQLTEIRDGYGNWLQVTRAGNVWTFEEGRGDGASRQVARTHVLTFEDVAGYTHHPNFQKRVKTMSLAAFSAQQAVYTFRYQDTYIQANNCSTPAVPELDWYPPDEYRVPLLDGIDLPDDSTWEMTYEHANTTACSTGSLSTLTLPVKGKITWLYTNYAMARDTCGVQPYTPGGMWSDNYPGVWKRTVTTPGNTTLEETTYKPELVAREDRADLLCGKTTYKNNFLPPRVFKNEVTSSTAGSTVNYYSAYRSWQSRDVRDAVIDNPADYGLPFTRTVNVDSLPLSQQVIAAAAVQRSVYSDYDSDAYFSDGRLVNQRLRVSRTVFNDDDGDAQLDTLGQDTRALRCKNAAGVVTHCWVQQTNSDFDGFGHYRTQAATSNIPGSAARTTYTNFNPGMNNTSSWFSSAPWVLGTYTTASVTEGTATRSTTSKFDVNTGVLISTQSGTGTGALVSATCRDATGFVTSQRWLGADGLAPPADACTAVRRSLEVFLVHSYTFTGGAVTGHTATWDGTTHKVIDETLDANTGLPSSTRDGAGLATTYVFDTSSRLTSLTPPGLATTAYVYTNASASGTIWVPATVDATTSSSDTALGSIQSQYQYDPLGRLWREKTLMPDDSWSVRETLYDNRGRKQSVSETEKLVIPDGGSEYDFSPTKKTTYGSYDVFGRPGAVTTPDLETTTFVYRGNRMTTRATDVATLRDAESTVTTIERMDAHGRLASVTEASGTPLAMTTSYTYDVSGALASVSMPSPAGTQTRVFTYNSRNLLASETHPELGRDGNGTITYSDFDARGQARRKRTGSASFEVTIEYDPAGRLTAVRHAFGAASPIRQFQFDPATGRLFASARFNYSAALGTVAVTESWQYDATTGLPNRRNTTFGDSAAFAGRTYATVQYFNDLGQVRELGYPFRANPDDAQRPVKYRHKNGLMIGVDGWVDSIAYHPYGTIATVTHNGGMTETWAADPNNMPRPRTISIATGTASHWTSGTYAFDGAGNIKAIGDKSYSYDPLLRLIGVTKGTTTHFTTTGFEYDAFGNFVAQTVRGCFGTFHCYTSSVRGREVIGTTNRFKDPNSETAPYDAAGNVLRDNNREFTYDAVNMTTSAYANGRTFEYLYNADDERLAAVEILTTGGYETTWTLRGFENQLLTVLDGENWKEDQIWRGTVVAGYNTPDGKRHYGVDHLGSPRVVTNAFGRLIGTQEFTPFGSGGSTGSGALQFTGHERDRANLADGTADLPDYAHARFLDTVGGRFLSIDTVLGDPAIPQSWNRYSYARNTPLMLTDPTGEYVDLSALDASQRAAFIQGLNDFTGNTYDVDANNHLVLVSVGADSSAAATNFVNTLITSTSAYEVVSTTGANRYLLGTNQIAINFTSFDGADYGGVDPRTFNLGSTAIHEWVHQHYGLFDSFDGTQFGPFHANTGWTSPVDDIVNGMRWERGLPLRMDYVAIRENPPGFLGLLGFGPPRSSLRFYDPATGTIKKVIRNVR